MPWKVDGSKAMMSCPGKKTSTEFGARVEGIAKTVAHEVDGEHGDHQRRAGKQPLPRILLEHERAAGAVEHVAPARFRRRHAQAEEGQPGFQQDGRSEEHTSELQSLMRISYAVFCLKTKN